MSVDFDKYLRMDKMPTLWCWGCGDGVILKALINAIAKMELNMDDVCVISGIGCSGRFSSYVNCNTVHTTHGRALAYATGIKMANPDKKVVVISGDGDSLAIGLNHTMQACRRNIDINLILINNFIYGLTNSQTSPTTPKGFKTATAPYGNIDNSFDACALAKAAGASYVARESVLDPKKIAKSIEASFTHKGFSFLEVISNCHINLGRKNKMGNAVDMLKWIDNKVLPKSKYDALSEEEKIGRLPLGLLHKEDAKEYTEAYKEVQERLMASKGGAL